MSGKQAKQARKEAGPERDWTQERDLRCIPVAHEIFKMIAGLEKLPINHDFMTKDQAYQIYFDMNKSVSGLISAKNVDIKSDMEFIWQCVGEVITIIKKLSEDSIERNESILKDAIFNVNDGEPDLYTATKLAKMIEKKEEIREAVKKIIEA